MFRENAAVSLLPQRNAHPYPSSLSAEQVETFAVYLELLHLWTRRIDLVAPASLEVLLERHLLDSWAAGMVLFQFAAIEAPLSYLDIGSGAGLPGLPFAVFEPEREVYLCEPREKRATFLQNAISRLSLGAATPKCARAEDLEALEVLPGLVTARAVGKTGLLFSTALRLGGDSCLVSELLGPSWNEGQTEEAVKDSGCSAVLKHLIPYTLFDNGPQRQIAIWSVSRETR